MAITDNFKEGIVDVVNNLVSADKLKISEAIFKKTQEVTNVTNSHTVVPGVRNGQLIPIIDGEPNYESFPFNQVNSCDAPECGVNTKYSTYKWNLGLIECRIPICLRSFEEDFLLFWNQFRVINPDISDINSAYMAYIIGKVKTDLLAAQWRVVYFGDTSSSSRLFNGFDGFYTQMESRGGNNLPIIENTAANLSGQKMTGEKVYEILEQMYKEASDTDWFDETKSQFIITRFMAQPFIDYLNRLADKVPVCCDIINPDNIQKQRRFTLDNISFHGIPVKVYRELDGVIKGTTALNGGSATSKRVNPNRVILTQKTNLLIGTSETKNLNYFDVFYDKKDKKIYIDANSYLGAGVPTEEFITAGLVNV
jgi:hypothetical protein